MRLLSNYVLQPFSACYTIESTTSGYYTRVPYVKLSCEIKSWFINDGRRAVSAVLLKSKGDYSSLSD